MRGNWGILAASLLVSVLLHAGFFFFFIILNKAHPTKKDAAYEITLYDRVSADALFGGSDGSGSQSSGEMGQMSRLSLEDLGIRWDKSGRFGIYERDGSSHMRWLGRKADGTGAASALQQTSYSVLFDYFRQTIDQSLTYPREFIDAEIEGSVSVELHFSRKGFLMIGGSRFRSASKFLRVFVHRMIQRTFSEPIPSTYRENSKLLIVPCFFLFEIVQKHKPLGGAPASGFSSGTQLSFYRSARVLGQWQLGPITGYGLVPSIGINPLWAFDKVVDLLSSDRKTDPLRRYRDDPLWND